MTVRRLTRQSFTVLAVLLVAILLSGCVEIRMESEFNEDGSARHTLQSTIEKEGLEQLNSMGGEGEIDAFDPEDGREEAEAAGLEFSSIDTDELVGARLAKSFEDGEQVGANFDEMFTATADEDSEPTLGAVTGTFVKDGDTYRLNLTINSDILFESSGVTDGEADGDEMPFGSMDSFIDATYTATMPGEVTETNGTDLGDGKIEWELPLTGVTEITAVSEVEGSGGFGAGMLAIVLLVGALLLGGLGAALLFMRRRSPVPYAAGPGTTTYNAPPTSQPDHASFNTAPNVSPSGVTNNPVTNAPPSRSLGTNAPPLARTDAPEPQPTHEQDTTKLP